MADYQRILLAADFHEESRVVLERASRMAALCQARLSLLHVVETVPVETGDDLMMPPSLPAESDLVANAERQLASVAASFNIPHAQQFIRVGQTKREILTVAGEEGSDLIIVGSHGRHGLALLLGSTANAVLHGAPCDVLAVRI